MRPILLSSIAAAAVSALAGCSATMQSAPVPAPANGSSIAQAENRLPVRMTIAVPKHRERKPKYLSPATQSIAVTIVKGKKTILNETVDLTPSSKGCTSSLASTLCTLTIFLGPGKYGASLTTYDALGATGNALSTAQGIGFTIESGKVNTIPLTLSGIPAKILVTNAGSDSVYAFAQDADGNFIVGAGAPAFSASNASGPDVATISGPTASKPNLITFALASPPVDGTETIAVTATYPTGTNACVQAGAVCSAPAAITASYAPQLLAGNYAGNVVGFAVPLTGSTETPDVNIPVPELGEMAGDAHGNVFATTAVAAQPLYEISPPYDSATIFYGALAGVQGLAVGANGNLYAANDNDTVSALAPPYTGAPIVVTNGLHTPFAVAADASGNLYVANINKTVTAYAGPAFSGAPVSISTASLPLDLTIVGSTLYAGEQSDVETFALPLSNGEHATATIAIGNDDAESVAVDASGNVYVAIFSGGAGYGSLEEFQGPLTSGELPVATVSYTNAGVYGPDKILLAPDGYLYVGDFFGGPDEGGIDEFALPLTSSSTPRFSLATSALSFVRSIAAGQPIFTVTP